MAIRTKAEREFWVIANAKVAVARALREKQHTELAQGFRREVNEVEIERTAALVIKALSDAGFLASRDREGRDS